MKACEIAAVFEEIAPISSGMASDIQAGLLGFRFGSPDVEVTGVGMCWWMSEEVIDAAIAKGLNLLVCHEPEIWRWYESPWHTNLQPQTLEFNVRKMRKLLEHDMCVYTAHSNWDVQKDVGMGVGFARALAFSELIRRDGVVGVYHVGPMRFAELIDHVKLRLRLDHVRVQGDPDKRVETVVLGWGSMGSEVEAILANHADAGIFGELREWSFLFAREASVGIIETTHTVSESLGALPLVEEMKRRLPGVRVEFLEVPFPCRLA